MDSKKMNDTFVYKKLYVYCLDINLSNYDIFIACDIKYNCRANLIRKDNWKVGVLNSAPR